jgi:hypothetical protein
LAVVAFFAAAGVAGLILGVRFGVSPVIALQIWCGLAVALALLILMSLFGRSLRARPSLSEVAERLDLATNKHNSIATAEEFLRVGTNSGFEKAAIADGLRRIDQLSKLPLELPRVSFRWGRCAALVLTSAILISGAMIWPVAAAPAVAKAGTLSTQVGGSGTIASNRQPDRAEETTSRPPASVESPGSNSGTSPTGPSSHADSAGAVGSDVDAVSSGTVELSAVPPKGQSNPSNAGDPRSESTPPGHGNSGRAEVPRPQAVAPQADAGADGAPRKTKQSGGSQSKSGQAQAGNSKEKPPSSGGGSANGASAPPPDAPPPESGNVNGDNGSESDQPMPDGFGSSSALAQSNEPKGDGKTNGKGQPKKSRGVAPLLLGTRQPDLFQGRPMAGPDERTKIQLPAKRDPGDPSATVAAADRIGDERAVGSYQIPEELRGVVGDYFQTFHDDAAAIPGVGRN